MNIARSIAALLAIPGAAVAQPYDDAALMRQMGFVAGQAVACGLDAPLIASAVTERLVDAMGYEDDASRGLVAEGRGASEREGCRPLADEDRQTFKAIWAGMKRKAGVD